MQPTPYQLELLSHTLGIAERCRRHNRNHFVAGLGDRDLPHLEALTLSGLMKRVRTPAFLADGDMVFAATEAGIDAAVAALAVES